MPSHPIPPSLPHRRTLEARTCARCPIHNISSNHVQVVGNKWDAYIGLVSTDYTEIEALDMLELRRYCCRRMLMTHVDLIEKLLKYKVDTDEGLDGAAA